MSEPVRPPAAVEAAVERWKRDLLDLTGRNRLLAYRPSRSSLQLHIDPAAAFRQLTEDPTSARIRVTDDVLRPAGIASGRDDLEQLRVVRETRGKALAATARTFLEEQGIHVLYVPFGWLEWPDPSRPPRDGEPTVVVGGIRTALVRSPLLLVPVRLERPAGSWSVAREPIWPVEPNLTLAAYLALTQGISIEFDDDADDLTPDVIVERWKAAIGDRPHMRFVDEPWIVVDTFSFKKVALVRELEDAVDRVASQPVLRALAGDASLLAGDPGVSAEADIDATAQPLDPPLVLPADASQVRAIVAVRAGANLVIQGPPGTGKSQTITNLIAALVADGKRVLFVAEKRVAREVVMENLEAAGLRSVALHITEEALGGRSRGGRHDVLAQLQESLDAGRAAYPVDAEAADRAARLRDEANAYVSAVHSLRGSLPWSSIYELVSRAGSTSDSRPLIVGIPAVDAVDPRGYELLVEAAARVDDSPADREAGRPSPWLPTARTDAGDDEVAALSEALDFLTAAPAEVAAVAGTYGLSSVAIDRASDYELLARHLRELAELANLRGKWFRFAQPRYWELKNRLRTLVESGGKVDPAAAVAAARVAEIAAAWPGAAAAVLAWLPNADLTTPRGAAERAFELRAALPTLRSVARIRASLAAAGPNADVLVRVLAASPDGEPLRISAEAALANAWADAALATAGLAGGAVAQPRERLRARFRDAQAALVLASRAAVLDALGRDRPGMLDRAPKDSELGVVRQQINARRRRPLRWLFSNAPNLILQLRPCVVASPLAVAQFLHHTAFEFDVLIFDEASQIPTADAVVAMTKARQVVVVGDRQQMPPTRFFDRVIAEDLADADVPDEFESVLEECDSLLPSVRLGWHYRSRDERLIAFSNREFYDGALLTFPSAWRTRPDQGVFFEFVEGAVYGRGTTRANPIEAARVADLLAAELAADPEAEVMVTAMSVAHGEAVQAEIDGRSGSEASLAGWIERGGRVKNLETVQGDECDVMLLSFGYGRDETGRLALNFGPLSYDDGYRRLNVAVTRARRKTVLVAGIRVADLPDTGGHGARLIRRYLEYAEGRGATAEPVAPASSVTDAGTTAAVARGLSARGWQVVSQVGAGRARIDLAVVDPEQPDRYLAGIEGDGPGYRSAESARDREIGRDDVLRRMGWTLHRFWTPDWRYRPGEVVEALDAALRSPIPEAVAEPLQSPVPAPGGSAEQLAPGLRLYRPHQAQTLSGNPSAWIARLVRDEGPLHEEEILQALRDDTSRERLAGGVRDAYLFAVRNAAEQGLIERRGVWYWERGADIRAVEVPVARGGARRPAEYYADEQLLRAMGIACAVGGSVPLDALPSAAAQVLGTTLAGRMGERLAGLGEAAVREGWVRAVEGRALPPD